MCVRVRVLVCVCVSDFLAACSPDAPVCFCVATYEMVEGDIYLGFLQAE